MSDIVDSPPPLIAIPPSGCQAVHSVGHRFLLDGIDPVACVRRHRKRRLELLDGQISIHLQEYDLPGPRYEPEWYVCRTEVVLFIPEVEDDCICNLTGGAR